MAYQRGRYGIEYHPPVNRESRRLRWILPCLALLVAVSYGVARVRRAKPVRVEQPTEARASLPAESQPAPPAASPATESYVSARPGAAARPAATKPATPARRADGFVAKVDGWINSRPWSNAERELLLMLRDAEEQGHLIGACGAIENLIYRPATEDLKDQLVRRLSELNTQRLFSGANTPWTATITVRPGDNLQRIANKNKTTTDALLRLNPRLKNPDKLTIGQSLRTLHYPDADLVVHKKLQCADLSLKKRLFKRFYVSVRDTVEPGAYPVEAETGARAADRLKTIFKLLTPADRQELRLFLAPGSRITVTAQ